MLGLPIKKYSSNGMAQDEERIIHFMGTDQPYSEVFAYYEMIRSGFDDYCKRHCHDITPSKELYIISFKQRVDNVADMLGISARVSIPLDLRPSKKKKKETNEENEDGEDK